MVSDVTRRLDAGLTPRILLLCVIEGGFTFRAVPCGPDKTKLVGGKTSVPSEYAKTLGGKLRAIRQQQGLSLHGVEEKSKGRWNAVVVGSYERGDRAVTVQKLAELAEPVEEMLANPAYRQNAERMRAEIATLPGPERALELLERLTAERRPLVDS